MSELMNVSKRCAERRWDLLATVSAAALIGSAYAFGAEAATDDADRPTVWIELGGQLERVDSAHSVFAPAFVAVSRTEDQVPMIDSQKPPAYGFGGEGRVTFTPDSSNWVFSAAIKYGRSNGTQHRHHQSIVQTPSGIIGHTLPGIAPPTNRQFFGDGQTEFHESHDVLDFKAGKDVGLGLFGSGGSSVISAGVRFAQFSSSSDITLHARPHLHLSHNIKYPNFATKYNRHITDYDAVLNVSRGTHAIGPSLSWDASAVLARPSEHATLDLDWGVNGSILFGRQKARVHHQTSTYHYDLKFFESYDGVRTQRTAKHTDQTRTHSVIVPDVGGFAGVSLRFFNAKVSLGYRADFFINAIDTGIDARKSENESFYGPFATISIGLGG